MVADNDLALGRVVDEISHSKYWKDSAIFVVEDDCENNSDHVDGHRTVGFVISPYAQRGIVNSTYYSQINMVRTIEQILGLPPMNQMDLTARPMSDVFTDHPDFTPYTVVPNNVPLYELNGQPSTSWGKVLENAWTQASTEKFSGEDIDKHQNLRSHAVWYSTKGFDKPFPGDKKVLFPNQVDDTDTDK